ncbi:FecR domain-containing protein [Sphingopyxis sp.]|jgi:transmembrane sensor|uniref:FecR family protein n=1 Tax=Sphingopyxis sp. TaxID=1908224 RepID=UPI0025CFE92E|nr:FecR domain-containing protein [Sphingopyxis sp.]MBK6414189.1 FecR domain-containing protein [Sphingopyxis sp.]
MRPDASPAEARAIDWLIRQRDPAFDDWDGFADWLDEDSEHAAIYDAVASLDQDLDGLPPMVKPLPIMAPAMPRHQTRRAWFGSAMAAALVAVIGVSTLNPFGNSNRIQTAAGEHRTIELVDGSRIEINGGSVVEIDKDRPRFARLETGEAMFHVVHRNNDPFVVETGNDRIVDLGTAFNVVRRERQTSVAVSEGIVLYNPDRDKVRLVAGKAIEVRDGDRQTPIVQDVDVTSIGGWRTGLLVYNDAPLAVVAEDLKRTAGMDVHIAPTAVDLSFRGALIIDADRNRTIADLAALSGTKVQRQGNGWILTR